MRDEGAVNGKCSRGGETSWGFKLFSHQTCPHFKFSHLIGFQFNIFFPFAKCLGILKVIFYKERSQSLLKPSCANFLKECCTVERKNQRCWWNEWCLSRLIWAWRMGSVQGPSVFQKTRKTPFGYHRTVWLTCVICLVSARAWLKTKENTCWWFVRKESWRHFLVHPFTHRP